MAEDLEDGELWLPSDFFSTDEPQPPQITSSSSSSSSPCRCMHAFRRISSPSLLPPLPHLQCMPTSLSIFDPPVRRPWPGCSPLNPVGAQIETFMGERARPGPLVQMPNRVHGGTGVFLPRASSYPQAQNHAQRTSDSLLRTTLPDGRRRKLYAGYGAAEVDLANVWNY